MSYVYTDPTQNPFRDVCYITVSWSDGTSTQGSGCIVGRNDVLTASHIVSRGVGSTVRPVAMMIYAGYDGGSSVYATTQGTWSTNYLYTFQVAGTLDQYSSSHDFAVIGLSDPIGDRVGGWLELEPYAYSGYYTIAGYPGAQNGRQVADTGYVNTQSGGTLNISSVYHAAGSSGSPIIDQAGQVVGVVSTTMWGARIDSEYWTLRSWIAGNDGMITSSTPSPGSSPARRTGSGDDHAVAITAGGKSGASATTTYSGPVKGLQNSYIAIDDNAALLGTRLADFIKTGNGDDAIDGGNGSDVLDGGLGSNFLTGGAGTDTFFVDARGGGVTWSTVTDLEPGEWATAWGWKPGTSTLSWDEMVGAAGYKGATARIDLDGNGTIDESLTFSGKLSAALWATPGQVENNSYIAFILK